MPKKRKPGRPRKKGPRAKAVSISVPSDLHRIWKKVAKGLEMKISGLSVEAIKEYLEKRGINPLTGELYDESICG